MELILEEGSRLACVGRTGTGKSLLTRGLFKSKAGRKVVIDQYDSEITEHVGELHPITQVSEIDWAKSDVWRIVPGKDQSPEYYDALYDYLFESYPVTIWTDEVQGITSSHTIPPGLRMVEYQGRKRGISHYSCSTRPANCHPSIWSQADHWAIFKLSWAPDIDRVASSVGIDKREFLVMLKRLGPHGFIWWDLVNETKYLVNNGLPELSAHAIAAPVHVEGMPDPDTGLARSSVEEKRVPA